MTQTDEEPAPVKEVIMLKGKADLNRETFYRAVKKEYPAYIPMSYAISGGIWSEEPDLEQNMYDLMEKHPLLFPGFVHPHKHVERIYTANAVKDHPFTDDFGCLWETSFSGMVGTVTGHPLDDWDKWPEYQKRMPDPTKCMGIGPIDWAKEEEGIRKAKENGNLTMYGLRHGHTWLQICDICGYENVLFGMEDEEPALIELLDKLTDFNTYIIDRYVDNDVDCVTVAEDLGMQIGPMLSPADFDKYILPCYKRIIKKAKEKGTIVHMHSDGDIRTLTDSLLECGMDVLNLQDLVNGIDWIRDNLKPRTSIELDIDRQKVTRFGTPKDIDDLIHEEVDKLGSKEGGLMMVYGQYPGIPIENASALMDAMEKYAFYYK